MDDFEKAFERHLGLVRQGRRYRLLQGVATLRDRALPYMAGLVPGSLLADRLYPGTGDEGSWVMVALGAAVIITPVVYALTRKHRDFAANKVFYSGSVEADASGRKKETAIGQ
jgi:hypothetical protein